MNEPRDTLDTWLAAARADLARETPPEWIESALAARQSELVLLRRLRPSPAAKEVGKRRRPRPAFWWFSVPAGAVALLVLGVAVLLFTGTPSATASGAPAFIALTPLETIAAEPSPVVVTSEVPRAQLASFGLPVDPARADLPVRAEFLVSQRGTLLAVRFSPE
jgi:hypothetical protein